MRQPPRTPSYLSIFMCALGLALALGSCGSSSDESAASTPTPVSTTEPVLTPTPAASTPAPTAAAAVAAPTPTAIETTTNTPEPTSAPSPTGTPVSTATSVPAPTGTPSPTATVGPTPTPTPPPGGVITAAVDETFIVSFEVDSTTNFTWQLDELPPGSLLTLLDEINIAAGGGTTSGTGWQHFVFRGDADGQATLTFWFVRPNGAPMDEVTYSVILGSGTPACSEVFNVSIGEEFEIVLQSNSSTGFRWALSERPSNAVKLVKEEYIAAGTNAVGASGWQRFTFRGADNGETDLNFWYVRPFDDPPAPANVANYKAVVGTGVPGCSAIFTIETGEEFTIDLGSDSATGYWWELSESLPSGVLALVKDEFVSTGNTSTGVQRLTFQGIGTGETSLRLWHVRPTDDPPDPIDNIAFMVIVDS